jgi:ADP-ribose pyrophosphatase YjhB (NUDIX family)
MKDKKITLKHYPKTLKGPLPQRSLCFLLRADEVLLGKKKQGFGRGRWLGIGGRIEEGETIEKTAIRETLEEISVNPIDIKRVATLNFYFPYVAQPDHWNQQVCVFVTRRWEGNVQESEEIAPQWFDTSEIPFNEMWADASYWLPEILAGKLLTVSFLFDEALAVEDYQVIEGKY